MELPIKRRVISINLSDIKRVDNPYQSEVDNLSVDQLYTVFNRTNSFQLIGAAFLRIVTYEQQLFKLLSQQPNSRTAIEFYGSIKIENYRSDPRILHLIEACGKNLEWLQNVSTNELFDFTRIGYYQKDGQLIRDDSNQWQICEDLLQLYDDDPWFLNERSMKRKDDYMAHIAVVNGEYLGHIYSWNHRISKQSRIRGVIGIRSSLFHLIKRRYSLVKPMGVAKMLIHEVYRITQQYNASLKTNKIEWIHIAQPFEVMVKILTKLGFNQVAEKYSEFTIEFGKYGLTRSVMAGDMLLKLTESNKSLNAIQNYEYIILRL